MIKVRDLVPEVYYKKSRDFQLLGRTFDVALNYIISNYDNIINTNDVNSVDESLLELQALKLGFKLKHNYNVKQLRAICSCLSEALKCKGTKKSVEIVVNALLHNEGISAETLVSVDTANHLIRVFIPGELTDTSILNDLLDYILPAGISCTIIKHIIKTTKADSELAVVDDATSVSAKSFKDDTTQLQVQVPQYISNVETAQYQVGKLDTSVIVPRVSLDD